MIYTNRPGDLRCMERFAAICDAKRNKRERLKRNKGKTKRAGRREKVREPKRREKRQSERTKETSEKLPFAQSLL